MLGWWTESCVWDGMSGAPSGPPEWPDPGGYWHQLSKVVKAVSIMRDEFARMKGESKTPETPKGGKK